MAADWRRGCLDDPWVVQVGSVYGGCQSIRQSRIRCSCTEEQYQIRVGPWYDRCKPREGRLNVWPLGSITNTAVGQHHLYDLNPTGAVHRRLAEKL